MMLNTLLPQMIANTDGLRTYDTDAALWRHRYYDSGIGRFTTLDTFEGQPTDPITLNQYIYGGADPVNMIDPNGHAFTVAEVSVTFGIIGGLVGATTGTYIGYERSGTLFSWQTLGDALLGAGAGAAIGLILGAGIGTIAEGAVPFNALTSIAKISSKLIQQFAGAQLFRTTPLTFTVGVIAGAGTEILFPDRFKSYIGTAALFGLPADSFALLVYDSIVRRVPGPAQESLAFVAGFNVGYFGAKDVSYLSPDFLRAIGVD